MSKLKVVLGQSNLDTSTYICRGSNSENRVSVTTSKTVAIQCLYHVVSHCYVIPCCCCCCSYVILVVYIFLINTVCIIQLGKPLPYSIGYVI